MIPLLPAVGLLAAAGLLWAWLSDDNSAGTPVPGPGGRPWFKEWGEPNQWDRMYPDHPGNKALPPSWDHLEPTFRTRVQAVFQQMVVWGLPARLGETGRTQRTQAHYYGQGRPNFPGTGRPGKEITWTLKSNHGKYPAQAVDVRPLQPLDGPQEAVFYAALGRAALAQGLGWGGTWKVKDLGHLELRTSAISGEECC